MKIFVSECKRNASPCSFAWNHQLDVQSPSQWKKAVLSAYPEEALLSGGNISPNNATCIVRCVAAIMHAFDYEQIAKDSIKSLNRVAGAVWAPTTAFFHLVGFKLDSIKKIDHVKATQQTKFGWWVEARRVLVLKTELAYMKKIHVLELLNDPVARDVFDALVGLYIEKRGNSFDPTEPVNDLLSSYNSKRRAK